MTGKISEDPDKVVDGSEKLAAAAGGQNYGIFVASIATYLASLAQTLSNKAINASNNTITNLTTAMFASNVVDTDGTLAANSDTRIASQKAVKTYADALIAANDAMVFKGVIDCSASPNYPAANSGWVYKVSVAGKIGGASGIVVEAGDQLLCITDGTVSGNQATVGANWNVIQANIDGAVTGPASATSGRIATFNGATGKIIQDGGAAISTDGTLATNSDAKVATEKAVKTYVDAHVGGGDNILDNPDGQFNQRAPTSNADSTFGHDRWKALTQTGTIAVSTVNDAENGSPFMMRLTQSQASAQRMGYIQFLASPRSKLQRGKSVTLSARIKCSASQAIRYAILEWTGTADTVTADVVNDWTSSTYTAGNFFVGSNVTVTAVGSITPSAATLTDITALTATLGSSGNNLGVFFWTEGTAAQNVTLDIKAQLEVGTAASSFRKRIYSAELANLQQFFRKSFSLATRPQQAAGSTGAIAFPQIGAANTSQFGVWIPFGSTMYTDSPTVTYFNYAAANAQIRNASIGVDWSGTTTAQVTAHGFFPGGTSPVGSSPGHGSYFHYTAEAEIF